MRSSMFRKKGIYDKRPEDHPRYPEEWKEFWEKRYKELQAQGKDADHHDYKCEWIPHWSKRVAALYEEELAEKTEGLLSQYDLASPEEPKRPRAKRNRPADQPEKRGFTKEPSFDDFMSDYASFREQKGKSD